MSTVKLVRPPANPIRVGATTQRFFDEGEEHEAKEWKDVILPPDDVPEKDPEAEFESFDKIPKKRSPMITVTAIGAFLLVGSAAWAMAFGMMRSGASIQDSARALLAGLSSYFAPDEAAPEPTPPSAVAASENATTNDSPAVAQNPNVAPEPAATAPAATAPAMVAALSPSVGASLPGQTAPEGTVAQRPLVVPMASSSPTTPPTIGSARAAGSARKAASPRVSTLEIVSVSGAEPAAAVAAQGAPSAPIEGRLVVAGSESGGVGASPGASLTGPSGPGVRSSRTPDDVSRNARNTSLKDSESRARDDRSPALRGYVWSPSAKALVPAEPSLPTTDPDFARSNAGSAGSSAGSSSLQTGTARPAPSTPTAAPTAAPPSGAAHGVVAPADIGAAPAERPAPTGPSGATTEPPAFAK